MSTYRQKYFSEKINLCTVCHATENLEVHHIDGDRDNNELDNLTALCGDCHNEVHYGSGLDGELKELREKLPSKSIGTKAKKKIQKTFYLSDDVCEILEQRDNQSKSVDKAVREVFGE